jgi:hypothetical protein
VEGGGEGCHGDVGGGVVVGVGGEGGVLCVDGGRKEKAQISGVWRKLTCFTSTKVRILALMRCARVQGASQRRRMTGYARRWKWQWCSIIFSVLLY